MSTKRQLMFELQRMALASMAARGVDVYKFLMRANDMSHTNAQRLTWRAERDAQQISPEVVLAVRDYAKRRHLRVVGP